jgi:hypothetical protein
MPKSSSFHFQATAFLKFEAAVIWQSLVNTFFIPKPQRADILGGFQIIEASLAAFTFIIAKPQQFF